jgi:hypothetical protein
MREMLQTTSTSGEYEVKWDATDVASGTYFYKVTAGNFVQTRKMVLLK